LREGQRQQDEHGDHDTVSEDRNNKIHPGARFLQVKIPHQALGEMRSHAFPQLPDSLAGFGPGASGGIAALFHDQPF